MDELHQKFIERQETAGLIINFIYNLLAENNFSLAIHKQHQKIVLYDHEINNLFYPSIKEKIV